LSIWPPMRGWPARQVRRRSRRWAAGEQPDRPARVKRIDFGVRARAATAAPTSQTRTPRAVSTSASIDPESGRFHTVRMPQEHHRWAGSCCLRGGGDPLYGHAKKCSPTDGHWLRACVSALADGGGATTSSWCWGRGVERACARAAVVGTRLGRWAQRVGCGGTGARIEADLCSGCKPSTRPTSGRRRVMRVLAAACSSMSGIARPLRYTGPGIPLYCGQAWTDLTSRACGTQGPGLFLCWPHLFFLCDCGDCADLASGRRHRRS